MNILMIGWEFPPIVAGGLGKACHGLAKSLAKLGVNLHFIIPKAPYEMDSDFLNLRVASFYQKEGILVKRINSLINPYATEQMYSEYVKKIIKKTNNAIDVYGKNLLDEVYLFSHNVIDASEDLDFDLIHVHDWVTYPAGIALKRKYKKPLIVHVHACEFNRTYNNPDPKRYEIERSGFMVADKVVTISELMRKMIHEKYYIPLEKIEVVYNGLADEAL